MNLDFSDEINKMTENSIKEYERAPFKQRTKKDRLSASGNIYFIFSNKVLKYIGQRHSESIKTRLNNHLFGSSYKVDKNGKQIGTVSKWHKVKEELDKGNEITFKTILIKPESLRKAIELELISKLDSKWNIQIN